MRRDRVKQLRAALVAAIAMVAFPLIAATDDVVNIFTWTNYIDSKAIPSFEKKTGIKVNYDLMDSNEALEGKLLAGKSGYDVVVPSMSFFAKQVEGGLYQPIPKAQLSNYKNLNADLMKRLARFDADNTYGVPYMWGTDGIAFNTAMIDKRLPNAPKDSWRLLFDPTVVSHFKDCGVALVDDSESVVESALIYLGRDPDSEKPEDLNAAIDVIAKIQPYVRYFHSTSYVDDLANGEICLAFGYSGDVLQATRSARGGVVIDYVLPKEGALLWIDVMAIPKDAPHAEAAAKWIDHILDPAVVAGISNAVFYANPNDASRPLLDPAVLKNPIVYPPQDVMAHLVLPSPKSQRFVKLRNRAWTQAKAGA
jgi:putrescine transport system substrate-binding protein